MTSPIKGLLRLALLPLAALEFGLAAPAASLPADFFIDATTPVYDLTGAYQFDQQVVGPDNQPADLSLVLSLSQDGAGRLTGAGSTTVQLGGFAFPAAYELSGRVIGGGQETRAWFVARLKLQDPGAGGDPPVSIFVKYNLRITPAGLGGKARGEITFADSTRRRILSKIADVSLPAGVDGSWSLQVKPPSADAAAGAGSIVLPNGRNVQAKVTRKSATALGVTRVRLSGTAADEGNILNVRLVEQTATLRSLEGRILGQRVSRNVAPRGASSLRACLECHTPVNRTLKTTPHAVAGVGCENCHGLNALVHAANYYDPTTRPKIDMTGKVCGNCHSGPQNPISEQWSSSAHATVVLDLNPPDRIRSCGRCHSGSVRESLLDGTPLPAEANVPIGCPVCHEPHSLTGNPAQLRNPLASTNNFSLSTSDHFATKYDPNIQICAQCHNDRGASWTSSSRPPHHSLQYNMLLGTVGELDSGLPHFEPATHAFLTNQCVYCHMHPSSDQLAHGSSAALTNHTFQVTAFDQCLACHTDPEELVTFVGFAVSNQVQQVKFELDYWALNNAPPELTAKYGSRAWEYTNPGELSPGGPGPTADEQKSIPINIQKARYNLYLVLNDGSFGVHNGPYAITLLDTARTWIESELGLETE